MAFLVHDHDVIKHQVSGLSGLDADELTTRLEELVLTLMKHESAENVAVYPAVSADVLSAGALSADLQAQEQEIIQLLSAIEGLDSGAASLRDRVDNLQSRVLEHLQDEELNLFPLLRSHEEALRRWELGAAYLRAAAAAPSRPHPGLSFSRTPASVVTPVAGWMDRVNDVVHREKA